MKTNRLIRVEFPTTDSAVADNIKSLTVGFPVKRIKIRNIHYKSNKPISNEDAEFLIVRSNMVPDGILGTVFDDIKNPVSGLSNIEFEFKEPMFFGGRYTFELHKSNGQIYTTHTSGDTLIIIAEFCSE